MFRVWEREIPKPDFAIHHAAKVGTWPRHDPKTKELVRNVTTNVGSVFDLSNYIHSNPNT